MLRFKKMTVKAQEAVQNAQEVAARHENQQIEPIHLLAALVSQADGVVHRCSHGWVPAARLCRRKLRRKWPAAKSAGFRPAAHG